MENKVFILQNKLQVIHTIKRKGDIETNVRVVHSKSLGFTPFLVRIVKIIEVGQVIVARDRAVKNNPIVSNRTLP